MYLGIINISFKIKKPVQLRLSVIMILFNLHQYKKFVLFRVSEWNQEEVFIPFNNLYSKGIFNQS